MIKELEEFINEIDLAFFMYAHITGSVEFYMLVLEKPELQRVVSKVISGNEIEWKQLHRFMLINGQAVTWYPELPVHKIIAGKNALLGFIYGITLSRMVSSIDYYLNYILKNYFGYNEIGGSSWQQFINKTMIDLLNLSHGKFVYTLLQERHKIEHNQAKIDRVFLERMAKFDVKHTYKDGDAIQKSHIDILLTHKIIREFGEDVAGEVERII